VLPEKAIDNSVKTTASDCRRVSANAGHFEHLIDNSFNRY